MVKKKQGAQGIVVRKEVPKAEPPPPAEDEADAAAAPERKKRKKGAKATSSSAEAPKPVQVRSEKSASALVSPLQSGDGARLTPTEVLEWLLWPITPATFFAEYWEKKPLHVRRGRPDHYGELFSKAQLDKFLKEKGKDFKYGERINLARFSGEAAAKIDMNKGPRGSQVNAGDVNAAWKQGATIQAMHIQQYHEPVWRLLVSMEKAFSALFGSNAYLTPSGQQGLAPHFDDVEVFMLQLEGKKLWKLNAPPDGEEWPLPRTYSRDFNPNELGGLLLETTVEPGDLLYLPRGTVHQGVTQGEGFSHHLTVSTYQKMAWSDFLERTLLSALGKASAEREDYRSGLPVGYLGYMGSWHDCTPVQDPEATEARTSFLGRLKGLVSSLQDYIDADEACDELGVDLMSQRLPPTIPAAQPSAAPGAKDKAASSKKKDDEEEKPAFRVDLDKSSVRWRDPAAIRAMLSTDPDTAEASVILFHSCSNTRGQHMCKPEEAEEDVGCLRFEAGTFMPAIHSLFGTGTEFMRVADLPLSDESDKIALCENLLENGLLEIE